MFSKFVLRFFFVNRAAGFLITLPQTVLVFFGYATCWMQW